MDCSMPGLPVHHQLPEFTQTHVHWISDAIQPSHPLLFSFPPAFNLSQCQGLFQWVSSSHQVVKVLEFQLQYHSFQWTFRNCKQMYSHLLQIVNKCCSWVAKSGPTLCYSMDCNMPGFSVYQQLPEFTQTHVHWISDPIQPSHPLSSPSPLAFNLSQHQGLFQWVSSSHQVAKILEFQLQHQSF